jgi:hypothetical protein
MCVRLLCCSLNRQRTHHELATRSCQYLPQNFFIIQRMERPQLTLLASLCRPKSENKLSSFFKTAINFML